MARRRGIDEHVAKGSWVEDGAKGDIERPGKGKHRGYREGGRAGSAEYTPRVRLSPKQKGPAARACPGPWLADPSWRRTGWSRGKRTKESGPRGAVI